MGRDYCGVLGIDGMMILKWILKNCGVWVWTGVKSLEIWASSGLLGTRYWTFDLHKRQGISWPAEYLLASKYGFYSIELVWYVWSYQNMSQSGWRKTGIFAGKDCLLDLTWMSAPAETSFHPSIFKTWDYRFDFCILIKVNMYRTYMNILLFWEMPFTYLWTRYYYFWVKLTIKFFKAWILFQTATLASAKECKKTGILVFI